MPSARPAAVVAASDPRASDAGARILAAGGNALDAAVAAALVLHVVEPQSCGPGGDAFLFWCPADGPMAALDGSGDVPVGLTAEALGADGLDAVPGRGPRSCTVPGAIRLFADATERFGRVPFADLVRPARELAANGYEVRPSLAAAAARAAAELSRDPVLGPLFVPRGSPVRTGGTVVNGELAQFLGQVGDSGGTALYSGEVAAAIAASVRTAGGYLAAEDLAAHRTEDRSAVRAGFRGHMVHEFPAPTQGPAVLAALERLEAMRPPVSWATVVDAVLAGMSVGGFDPRTFGRPRAAMTGDTTYLCAVDREGNGASLITSVFGDFGSQFGVRALGGPLGNRAAMFRALGLAPTPGRRPPHTTIPSVVTRDGRLSHLVGVAGGLMQPQAQVQLFVRLLDEGLGAQEAVDAPRFKVVGSGEVALEPGHPLAESMPEAVGRDAGPEGFGAAQVAGWFGGVLAGGADRRRGGGVAVLS